MSKIELLLLIVFLLLLILLFKYLQTKRQIRNLSKQIAELVNGKSEKMLDISLIDKDLEQFVPGMSTGCSTIFAQKGIPKMEQLSASLLLTVGILLLIAG